jgi:hypothetical protein
MCYNFTKQKGALLNTYKRIAIISGFTMFTLSGCMAPMMPNNSTQTGALTGILSGAILGANTKGSNKGKRMAIGATIGAIAGGLVGNTIDGQKQPQQTGGWQ